jgi:hypothetical protein
MHVTSIRVHCTLAGRACRAHWYIEASIEELEGSFFLKLQRCKMFNGICQTPAVESPGIENPWYIPGISQAYTHVIVSVILVWNLKVYTWYIPGIYHFQVPWSWFSSKKVYTWYIFSESSNHRPEIHLVYSIYLLHACIFETLPTALQHNRDWDAAAHRFWIARVFNVHHSTLRPH